MTRASPHPAEPRPARFANPVVRCLAATRPAFLTVTLVGCLIGIASAHAGGAAIDATTAVLTLLLALMDHVIAQGFAEDAMRTYFITVADVSALEASMRATLS